MDKIISSPAASISLRQLKFFETVGRVKSVRRASTECNLSQPAVTQALAKLEEQVGLRLLERRASGSYLNDLGQLFYRRVARFFVQMEAAITELGVPGSAVVAPIIANRFSQSHLRCLIGIVDCGSLTEAAERLEITASSLQRIARTIEENLGKSIFCSTAAGKALTPAGAEFGRKLKLALQEITWGIEEIDMALGHSTTEIIVGAMPYGGSVLLASVLEDFVSTHPGTEIKIVDDNAAQLRHSLKMGNVDLVIGLVQEMTPRDFDIEALAKTPYAVVARRGHPLSQKTTISIDDLTSHPWVIGTPGSSRRACFDQLFAGTQVPRASIATCALAVIHHLLKCSDRLTLMTSYELTNDDESLASLPFGNIEPVPSIGITTRTGWLPTLLHRDFIDLLRKRMAEYVKPTSFHGDQRIAVSG